MRGTNWILLVGLLGCGDDAGTTTPADAAIDAVPDAPPDAPLADAPPPAMGHHHFVIDRVLVPTSNPTARDYGMDLNGDQTVDNQLGMVFGTFNSMGLPVQAGFTASIDQGNSITLVDLAALDLTTAATATIALYDGTMPMPAACNGAADLACRRHLAGTGTFVPAATPVNAPLAGAITAGTLTAGPGQLALDLVFSGATPVSVTLLGARVRASMITPAGIGTLIIAGAIPLSDFDTKIYPAMRDGYNAQVAADCTALTNPPQCGCAPASDGATALSLLDAAPKDCTITVGEIQSNSLFQALFAPDVTINNTMAVSIGVNARAVPAGFAEP